MFVQGFVASVLIEHVPQVIQMTGKSLYHSSEQVVEASHAKFDKMWEI